MKVIGGDMGKHELKVVSNNGRASVRSKVDLTDEVEVSGNSYLLDVNGKRYMIGEQANNEDFDVSKEKLHHKLLMWLGIAKSIDKYEDVNLMVGCPLSTFLNREKREQYRKFLLDDYVSIGVNGKRVDFRIRDIKIVCESIGYLYRNPQQYKGKLLGVIDIGGLNTNGAIYDNLKPIKETAFTLNEGGNILNTKIKNSLKSGLGLNIQDYEVKHILSNGVWVDGKQSEIGNRLVSDVMSKHIETIIREMKRNNWNLQGLQIVFSGGGSTLLADHINTHLEHAIISDGGKWDNADGFYRMGRLVWQ